MPKELRGRLLLEVGQFSVNWSEREFLLSDGMLQDVTPSTDPLKLPLSGALIRNTKTSRGLLCFRLEQQKQKLILAGLTIQSVLEWITAMQSHGAKSTFESPKLNFITQGSMGAVESAAPEGLATDASAISAGAAAAAEGLAVAHERSSTKEKLSNIAARCKGAGTDLEGSTWNVSEWLASLSLHNSLAASIDRLIQSESSTRQLAFVKALGEHTDGPALIAALLSETIEESANLIWKGANRLNQARASTARELVSKFRAEDGAFDMKFGDISSFHQGLEALIGPPSPNFIEAMGREHCLEVDSDQPFTTTNYGVTTTSITEWWFVYDPEKGMLTLKLFEWPFEAVLRKEEEALGLEESIEDGEIASDSRERSKCRRSTPLSVLLVCAKPFNVALEKVGVPPLLVAELIGGRLYTGPMFNKYNAVLRKFTGLHMIIDRFNELCRGNYYATTIHAINSCLLKLSKVTAAAPVYRGVGGGALPKEFLEKNEHNVSAAVDMGFMSTTYERNVAVTYAGTGAATVFEMEMGMVDRGAQLDWLSQYPHERECCFPPLTGLEVIGMRVEESVLVVAVRLSVNRSAETLEVVVSKMQRSHLQLIKVIRDDIKFTGAPQSALTELTRLEELAKVTDPSIFNNPDEYSVSTKRALEAQTNTIQTLALQETWGEAALSPEDTSKCQYACSELCSRVGDTESAITLLKLCLESKAKMPLPKLKKTLSKHLGSGVSALQNKSNRTFLGGSRSIYGQAVSAARETGLEMQETWRIEAADLLIASGALQPWPSTIVRLATGHTAVASAIGLLVAAYLDVGDPFAVGSEVMVLCDMGDCSSSLPGTVLRVNEDGTLDCVVDEGQRPVPQVERATVLKVDSDAGTGALLRAAANLGVTSIIEALLNVGASVHLADANHLTPLHLAAKHGHAQACKMLVSAKADPFFTDGMCRSAYELALACGHTECLHIFRPTPTDEDFIEEEIEPELITLARKGVPCDVEELLSKGGCNANQSTAKGVTALHVACRYNHPITADVLIAADADIEAKTQSGITPILLAVEEGALKVADMLCRRKANMCVVDQHRRSPLSEAAASGNVGLLELLLGADTWIHPDSEVGQNTKWYEAVDQSRREEAINHFNELGQTVLTVACSRGHTAAVNLLLQHSANPTLFSDIRATKRGVDTALIAACRANSLETVDLLIKFGCDPNYRPPITDAMANLDPWSPLIEAASNGRDAIVAALLAAKADPNLNLKGNASPLYFSACNGHLASTQMLFDAGARIDDGDRSNGRNGLWWAAKEGHTAVVKYLLGSDALVNYQLHEQAERAGTSALHMAAAHGRNECITVLVQGGADVALTEWKAGNTALHISAAEGHEEAVRRLLDGGADNTFTNNAGQRPSDVATAAGHERIATLIVKYHEAVEEIMTERGGTDGTSAQAASAHHLIQMNSSGGPSIVWRRVEWILRRGRLEENREGNRMGGMEC